MTDYSPEEYSEYRLQRALETIKEVEIHIENEFWNTADDVAPSTLSGVRQKFGQLFVKTG